jgi:hypothetical protein
LPNAAPGAFALQWYVVRTGLELINHDSIIAFPIPACDEKSRDGRL